MNDRLKFRFYDKKNKIMVYADTDNESLPYYQDEIYTTLQTYNLSAIENIANNKDYIVMQCTGLKDKNGKLIYEGDIIQIPNDYDTYGMFACEKREIYFNEGGFRLKPKWDKNSRGNWLEDTKDFEVIGNIYENNELLE